MKVDGDRECEEEECEVGKLERKQRGRRKQKAMYLKNKTYFGYVLKVNLKIHIS